jgi:hypothetical protein
MEEAVTHSRYYSTFQPQTSQTQNRSDSHIPWYSINCLLHRIESSETTVNFYQNLALKNKIGKLCNDFMSFNLTFCIKPLPSLRNVNPMLLFFTAVIPLLQGIAVSFRWWPEFSIYITVLSQENRTYNMKREDDYKL